MIRLLAALAILLTAGVAAAQSPGTPVPGLPIERHVLHDAAGREIVYYAGHPDHPAPILLMIQGSGCEPVMRLDGANRFSTLYDFLPYAGAGQFTVVAVEKPFAGRGTGGPPGTAAACGAEFNRDFTAESWLAALRLALTDIRRAPFVDRRRTLVLGTSEGAVMATLLAGADPQVTDVAAISGSGTTQLFDFIALAYRDCFDRSACLAEIDRQATAIRADPDSSTAIAWGHPYRRWTSFFRADPAAAMLRSHARLYLGIGTADRSVSPLSDELMAAQLQVAGHDVTIRRVDAGHGLLPAGADMSALDAEYQRIFDWFAAAR